MANVGTVAVCQFRRVCGSCSLAWSKGPYYCPCSSDGCTVFIRVFFISLL